MVLRSFFALDSSSMIVTSSSSAGIIGNPIINNSDTPNGTVFQYSSGTGTTVTLDDTGGSPDVFGDDDEFNHVITDGGGLVANGTPVESESFIDVRALDSGGLPTGPVIRLYVFSQNGITQDVWGFGSSAPLVDGTSYVKVSGSNAGSSTYTDYITCFADGSMIETSCGRILVEEIAVGQKLWTRDGGLQPVRWVGSTKVPGTGAFAPVVFAPHSIGNPTELVVSQQHRILLETPAAEVLFGSSDVLVAAKQLCGLPGVSIREQNEIRYTHFMFDQHQIVRANGVLTESFFLAQNSVRALDKGQRNEILSLFPELATNPSAFGQTATLTLKSHEVDVLKRHMGQLCA